MTSPTTSLDSLTEFWSTCRSAVDAKLDQLLPSEETEPPQIHQAIRWSIFAGGKRLRPVLLLATGEAFGASPNQLIATAAAVEMIHTYSLIHDDLPSMDDDDLRRGRSTCHKQFGEATAILAGDALQTMAFQTIAEDEKLSPQIRARVISELARGAGTPAGMIAGQVHDLEAESRAISGDELASIHRLKTGALIVAAARCGAIIAQATDEDLSAVTDYSAALGLLFQITDDLLDVTATVEDLGKTPGKDQRSEKATYASLYGISSARERAMAAREQACAALDRVARPTEMLSAIADFILHRRN